MGKSVENLFLNIQRLFHLDLLELVNLEISWLIYLRVDDKLEKSNYSYPPTQTKASTAPPYIFFFYSHKFLYSKIIIILIFFTT